MSRPPTHTPPFRRHFQVLLGLGIYNMGLDREDGWFEWLTDSLTGRTRPVQTQNEIPPLTFSKQPRRLRKMTPLPASKSPPDGRGLSDFPHRILDKLRLRCHNGLVSMVYTICTASLLPAFNAISAKPDCDAYRLWQRHMYDIQTHHLAQNAGCRFTGCLVHG